jgi:hypothetical protein
MGRGPINCHRVGGVCGTPFTPTRSAYSTSRPSLTRPCQLDGPDFSARRLGLGLRFCWISEEVQPVSQSLTWFFLTGGPRPDFCLDVLARLGSGVDFLCPVLFGLSREMSIYSHTKVYDFLYLRKVCDIFSPSGVICHREQVMTVWCLPLKINITCRRMDLHTRCTVSHRLFNDVGHL